MEFNSYSHDLQNEGHLHEEKEKQLLDEITSLHEKLKAIRTSRERKEKHRTLLNELKKGKASEIHEIKKLINNNAANKVILITRKLPIRIQRLSDTNFGGRRNDDHLKWKIEFIHETTTLDESLANYLSIYKTYPCLWVGMLDIEVDNSEHIELKEILLKEYHCVPVFVDSITENLFYSGYCKRILWPLFHSTLPTAEDSTQGVYSLGTNMSEIDADQYYEGYKSINQSFADVIQGLYNEGDVAMIVEYHFLLLPQMIRQLLPSYVHVRLGIFIQIPFPSSELYRILPPRIDLLHGMLASDLIGFQTYEYARHFQSACIRILGLESTHKGIRSNGHFTQIAICPMGIVPQLYKELVEQCETKERIAELEREFEGKKIILGIDVLDPTKGLLNKFLAIEDLFMQYPALAEEVIFVQIAIPTVGRSNTSQGGCYGRNPYGSKLLVPSIPPEYSALAVELDSTVARINGKIHKIGSKLPIQYFSHEMTKIELTALYSVADVFLVTSFCDGMNLLPFEYILSSRTATPKSVILSEFAGSAQCLSGAILVNPWSTREIVNALYYCIKEQHETEKLQALEHMIQYVTTFTAKHWGNSIIDQVIEASEIDENSIYNSNRKELNRRDVYNTYYRSNRRLLVFTYEGVLAKKSSIPELSEPSVEFLQYLSTLASFPENIIVIMSGHSMSILDRWFSHLGDMSVGNNSPNTKKGANVILAAEYGAFIKWSLSEPWRITISSLNLQSTHYWWKDVAPLLDYYSERTPGSYIERKEYGITWHYSECDQDHGFWQATELLMTLRETVHSLPLVVGLSGQSLEIRPHDATKIQTFKRIWEYLNTSEPRSHEVLGEIYVEMSPKSPYSRDRRGSLTYESPTTRSRAGSQTSTASTIQSVLGSNTSDDMNKEAKIDFLFVIASGDDRGDEDVFEMLIPPSVDLREYCDELQREGGSEKSGFSSLIGGTHDASSIQEKDLPRSVSNNDVYLRSHHIRDKMIAKEMSNQVLPRSTSAGKILLDAMKKKKGSNLKLLTEELTPMISDMAAKKFPSNLFAPTSTRQEEISNQSRFKPRKDFPPSAALFQAMKRKYGKDFDMKSIPNEPAAAWALVCPPISRGKVESARQSMTSSESSSSSSVVEYEIDNRSHEVPKEAEEEEDVRKPEQNSSSTSSSNLSPPMSSISTVPGLTTSPRLRPCEKEKYPTNTFLCTIGYHQVSQAPYFVKKLDDLALFLRDMGRASQLRYRENTNVSDRLHNEAP